MAYTPTTWVNNSLPALNATNLNKIENGISTVAANADTNTSNIGTMTDLENGDTLVEAINNRRSEYNLTTSGDPVKTGRTVDGNDEYVKRISIGSLPNSGNKDVATGVTINRLIKIEGSAYRSTDSTYFTLPFASNDATANISVFIFAGEYVRVSTGTDRSNLVGWVDMYYI